jgi:hypothetical protein
MTDPLQSSRSQGELLDKIISEYRGPPTRPVKIGMCPGHREVALLVLTSSMTAYADNERNWPFYVCCACSRDYTENMRDQWAAYYEGIM